MIILLIIFTRLPAICSVSFTKKDTLRAARLISISFFLLKRDTIMKMNKLPSTLFYCSKTGASFGPYTQLSYH